MTLTGDIDAFNVSAVPPSRDNTSHGYPRWEKRRAGILANTSCLHHSSHSLIRA